MREKDWIGAAWQLATLLVSRIEGAGTLDWQMAKPFRISVILPAAWDGLHEVLITLDERGAMLTTNTRGLQRAPGDGHPGFYGWADPLQGSAPGGTLGMWGVLAELCGYCFDWQPAPNGHTPRPLRNLVEAIAGNGRNP